MTKSLPRRRAAAKRRDDAVAAKKAEEEAAKRAEEAKRARTIDTDYFTMVLPDWFPIDEHEITSMNWSSVGTPAAFRVSKIGGNQDPSQDADFYILLIRSSRVLEHVFQPSWEQLQVD